MTDDVIGMFQSKGLIWIQGKDSLEPFYDTGQTIPFIRVQGGLVESGTVNPYALAIINNDIFFLNSILFAKII